MLSEGKSPLEVAIELNFKESKATKYFREYWKLNQLHDLDLIYEDIGDDIIHIMKLHWRMRARGVGVEQAINLIKIANNDLPALEQEYQKLKRDVNLLESQKFNQYKTLHDLKDLIDGSERTMKWLKTSYRKEETNINQILSEKIRLKRLVKQFKDNDEAYLKIKRTVQNKITNILLDGKDLLTLALYSLIESMKTDPQKYSKLIHYNRDSSPRNIDWQYTGFNYIHGQQPYPSFDNLFEGYESTLLEDTEKLFNKLVKEWTEQIMNEYSNKNSSPQLFKPDKEGRQQFQDKPSNRLSLITAISNNHVYQFKRVEPIFVKPEF